SRSAAPGLLPVGEPAAHAGAPWPDRVAGHASAGGFGRSGGGAHPDGARGPSAHSDPDAGQERRDHRVARNPGDARMAGGDPGADRDRPRLRAHGEQRGRLSGARAAQPDRGGRRVSRVLLFVIASLALSGCGDPTLWARYRAERAFWHARRLVERVQVIPRLVKPRDLDEATAAFQRIADEFPPSQWAGADRVRGPRARGVPRLTVA